MQGERILGVDGYGLVKAFDRFVPLAQCLQGQTPVKEHGRLIRLQVNGAVVTGQGGVPFFELCQGFAVCVVQECIFGLQRTGLDVAALGRIPLLERQQ